MKKLGIPSPYAVVCHNDIAHGEPAVLVYLTRKQYDQQMSRPDALWRCPLCGDSAMWDDDTYEEAMDRGDLRGGL